MDDIINQPPVEERLPDPNERVTVCDVQFRVGSKIYYFDPAGVAVKAGDHVIIETSRGPEYGFCTAAEHRVAQREIVAPLRKVLRVATARDEAIYEENKKREKDAFEFCLRKIAELGLEMQLVSTECAFDGNKLLFYFTADGRVDFRELVKILAFNYHTRIELRQIGVRDKAKMVGGLGICGRPFCCAQFLSDFQPVSIKMAKTQSLSLNPTKISGTCGRLMCCLKYEQEAYEDLIKNSPKQESFVDTPDGRGTVTDVNLMAQSVKVRLENEPDEIRCYKNCDICVLRNGRAKKTDPPIPEDLAPISGNRKSAPRLFEERLTAEPEETAAPEQPPVEPEQPAARSRRKGKEKAAGKEEQKKSEAPKKTEALKKTEAPKKADAPKKPKQEKQEKRKNKPEQEQKEPQKAPKLPQPEPPAEEQPKPKPRRKHYYHKPKKQK